MIHRFVPLRNARIKAAYEAGVLVDKIATEHGLAINTVFSILQKIKARHPNPAGPFAEVVDNGFESMKSIEARIKTLAAEGKTRKEISAETGVNYERVCSYTRQRGIKVRRQCGSGLPHYSHYTRKAPRNIPPSLRIAAEVVKRSANGKPFSLADLARDANVTREYAGQIFASCQLLGMAPKTGVLV